MVSCWSSIFCKFEPVQPLVCWNSESSSILMSSPPNISFLINYTSWTFERCSFQLQNSLVLHRVGEICLFKISFKQKFLYFSRTVKKKPEFLFLSYSTVKKLFQERTSRTYKCQQVLQISQELKSPSFYSLTIGLEANTKHIETARALPLSLRRLCENYVTMVIKSKY